MDLVEWRRVSGLWTPRSAPEIASETNLTSDAYWLHHIDLTTLKASRPVCIRLMHTSPRDRVKLYLGHKCHTPYLVPDLVDVFVDIWIDPFEFEAAKYDLDELPSKLSVHVEWEARSPESSLFVLNEPTHGWHVSLVE
jgi:hypothetical protein